MMSRLENPARSILRPPSRRSFLQSAASLLEVGSGDWVQTENILLSKPLFKIHSVSKHLYAAIAQTRLW